MQGLLTAVWLVPLIMAVWAALATLVAVWSDRTAPAQAAPMKVQRRGFTWPDVWHWRPEGQQVA